MLKNLLLGLGAVGLASAVLVVSLLQSCRISYTFAAPEITPSPNPSSSNDTFDINYQLPYPGKVLPGSILWNLKALRDKVWYMITFSPSKKAELALLFSDKRLVMSQMLLKQGNVNEAVATLTKGEKYLEISTDEEETALKKGAKNPEFLERLMRATLKHREVIEGMIPSLPDQARPVVIKTEEYSKAGFGKVKSEMISLGLPVPKDPFSGN